MGLQTAAIAILCRWGFYRVMDFFVTFDLPTLTFTVVLVMLLASLALSAHWIVNRETEGLRVIALGVMSFSVGSWLNFDAAEANSLVWSTAGELLVLAGHMWVWFGISDFWQMRHRQMVLLGRIFAMIAGAVVLYQAFTGTALPQREATMLIVVALMSLGIVRTLVQALGGSAGFYKGIIRRTTVGVGLAAGLFFTHALFGFYLALHEFGLLECGEGALPHIVLMHLETLIFVILLALIIIIMTAERLQAELRIQEMMDPLTRALNRRAFLEVMKAVLARARRLAEPVSLVMVDIDKFKTINLEHGRGIGDLALVEFASLVMEGRRNQDVFCRFGGEEFVLMLPGTPEEGADLVAARIKSKIEKASLTPGGVPIKLTISMGVMTARGDDLDADGMLDVVDRRMHNAQKLLFETIESA